MKTDRPDDPPFESRLNPRYTFEEFVVGPHNRFPHAAALAVSENLGKAYNPLFVYGPVGLGKTHLMQAVGHRVLERQKNAHVLYVTAEQFMTEVIELLRTGSLKAFREKYRSLELLLVDDIQFLAASESTQEEFFHTFNELHQAGKQIIMTSDRPPKMLVTLEDRLRSRFEWGLIADIKSPSLETRVAILRKKESQLGGLHLGEDIRLYIAGKLKSNVRELEGFLKRVQAYAQLNNQTISLSLVKEIMRELLPPKDWEEGESSALPIPATPAPVQAPEAPPPEPPTPHVTPAVSPTAINLDAAVLSASPAADSSSAEPGPKAIPVVFFFPAGREEALGQVKKRFEDVIRKHKLKFVMEAAAEIPYPLDDSLSYDLFPAKCEEKGQRIAVVLGPPPEGRLPDFEFRQRLQDIFEARRLSLQMLPWDEFTKDYRYLNLALDITLIRFKEG